jgi:hypothetical protein
LILAAK